jgi:hypothetical protein
MRMTDSIFPCPDVPGTVHIIDQFDETVDWMTALRMARVLMVAGLGAAAYADADTDVIRSVMEQIDDDLNDEIGIFDAFGDFHDEG